MIKMIRKMPALNRTMSASGKKQFIKFCIVGVSNTVISYIIYSISLFFFRKWMTFDGYDYFIAQVLMFILSVAWSFYWNNRIVFTKDKGEKRNLMAALLKTYISYSFTGLFLNSILLYIWINLLGISEFFAPVINLIISVPLNFLLNKFWAFKTN